MEILNFRLGYSNFRNSSSREEERLKLLIHFFTIVELKLKLLFGLTMQIPYKLSKNVCIFTKINPACFSKNEIQMITIPQPKMPLPYGKCQSFQNSTCSVRKPHWCFDWIASLSEHVCQKKAPAQQACTEAARLQQQKGRNVHADKLPVILRST